VAQINRPAAHRNATSTCAVHLHILDLGGLPHPKQLQTPKSILHTHVAQNPGVVIRITATERPCLRIIKSLRTTRGTSATNGGATS
jgi:hypothetical protein